VKLELVYIKPGKFMMGSNVGWDDEKPVHEVEITKGFYIGKYEVTQAQYERVTGINPSYFKQGDRPVDQIIWTEAVEFCQKLSEKTGRNFRLPTGAEWEYACRAGSTGEYCFGDDENKLGDYAWYDHNLGKQTHPVGQKKPNAWGLYDMHGNVSELYSDWDDREYDRNTTQTDPKGPVLGETHFLRGGSWYDVAVVCRSACRRGRLGLTPDHRDSGIGFRVVMDLQ